MKRNTRTLADQRAIDIARLRHDIQALRGSWILSDAFGGDRRDLTIRAQAIRVSAASLGYRLSPTDEDLCALVLEQSRAARRPNRRRSWRGCITWSSFWTLVGALPMPDRVAVWIIRLVRFVRTRGLALGTAAAALAGAISVLIWMVTGIWQYVAGACACAIGVVIGLTQIVLEEDQY